MRQRLPLARVRAGADSPACIARAPATGLLVIYIVSCAVFGAYVVANVSITPFVARGSQIAKVRQAYALLRGGVAVHLSHECAVHQMYRLLSAVVVAQFCSLILMVLHLLVYALNGSGLLLLQWLAQAADAAAQTCLAALLILLVRCPPPGCCRGLVNARSS